MQDSSHQQYPFQGFAVVEDVGLSENWGTLFWGPYNIIRILLLRVLYLLGSPIFRNPHVWLQEVRATGLQEIGLSC